MVSRHRAYVLEGASPPSFVSFFAYQTLLQTQRARRMMRKVPRAADSSPTKVVRRRGTRAREGQPRYSPKKRRLCGAPQETSRTQLLAPSCTAIAPQIAPVSSSASSSTELSPSSPTAPPSALWPLSPLSDAGFGFEPPSSAPSETDAESASATSSTKPAGNAGAKKKYPCDLCDKSFDYKHVLQNHNRTHTGEKPYQCPQCHKRFTRDHHLKTHIRLHTGEKPFGCSVCHKRFVQVANLRRHERVHAGERLHHCGHGHCDSALADCAERPTTHAKPFDCATCGAQFRRKRHREGHKCASDSATQAVDETCAFSVARTVAPVAPASAADPSAGLSSMDSGVDLYSSLDHDPDLDSRSRRGEVVSGHSEANGVGSEGRFKMDVGFRVIRNNRYHPRQLGRRYETWPDLHRHSQPCQEQPEDLSIKK